MRYCINKENYHQFDIRRIGSMEPRSYFIPFSSRALADKASINDRRYCSDKVKVLSGVWDFCFYPEPGRIPDELDTDECAFDTIDVPSCWQYRGYDKPFYVNTRYQFPFDPPHVPKEEPVGKIFCVAGADYGIGPRWITPVNAYNFVGIYRKKIHLDTEKQRIISFLGVSSCLDLYVNGSFVGYSEGSHNTAEFDLTPFLTLGENEILAVVHRWCTGSYLECQDMFRNSGIFRDVLLYELDPVDLWDVTFKAEKAGKGYKARVDAALTAEGRLKVTLCGHGLFLEQELVGKELRFDFEEAHVQEWTAETPTLYDLYLETDSTCVKLHIGFRQVQIQGDRFLLNGKKLKLKGVNHHDTHPKNGYTLTAEEIESDVRLCKAYNIDTVRTSHYPPDPILLDWCDELGIYVVDEADLETHGVFTQQMKLTYNTISHDPKWEDRYLERVQHLYHRDKNHPGILMWSLGNEAGGYRNTDAMYRWLKERSDLPVHYESAIHSRRVAYDVGSEMYPPLTQVEKVALHSRKEKQLNDRPYFLCEYAHAMGVGPGAVEEYWQLIYAHDNLIGGCIWEMVDHAVEEPDGRYTYGGDHGEYAHDGNFCVDGLFYPDRSPSTGAKMIRHAYRPIRIRHLDGCRYEIFNTNAFTNADVYRLRFLYPDGKIMELRIHLPPLTKKVFRIENCPSMEPWITVAVTDSRTDVEVSREQLVFSVPVLQDVSAGEPLPDWLELKEDILGFRVKDRYMTVPQSHTILFRAPTDNDRNFALKTAMDPFLDQTEERIGVAMKNGKLELTWRIRCKHHTFICTDTYEGCEEGVLVTSRLQCIRGKGDLPRFGKCYRLNRSFDDVRYLARMEESYCDMKEHTPIGEVSCKVGDMMEPNIKPQESGNRCDCSYVTISDGEAAFAIRAVDRPFELGIKPCTDRALCDMKHRGDMVQTGVYLTVSAFQMGIGTGSCGPATLPKYRFDAKKEYVLRFVISQGAN